MLVSQFDKKRNLFEKAKINASASTSVNASVNASAIAVMNASENASV